MPAIRYFILEDVPDEINALRENLIIFPEMECVGHASEVTDAVAQILEKVPDLLFWDYNLTGGTGLDILERLERTNAHLPCCVGTSAYKNFKMDRYSRFQHLFLDHFSKPFFNDEFDNRIRAIILKLRERIGMVERHLHLPSNGYFFIEKFSAKAEVVRIELAKIIRLEYKDKIVSIHLVGNTEVKTEISLSRLLTLLNCPEIRQVNRNNAINVRFLEKYEDGYAYMLGSPVPIAIGDFKPRFEAYLKVLNW